jgi:hypothetical protein
MDYFKIVDSPLKKTSELYKEMSEMFPCWKSSLRTDEYLDKNFPAPETETTRYFKKTIDLETAIKICKQNGLKVIKTETITNEIEL